MEFSPHNNIVKLCIQGMILQVAGKSEEAGVIFFQAFDDAENDFEKFLAAFFVAKNQENVSDKLKWFETVLQFALKVNDEAAKSAFYALYSKIAECHEELNDPENAEKNYALAASFKNVISDKGPFYHGTRADLQIGDFLTAGFNSNYQSEIVMNHIYFTALANGAGLAASLAKGDGRERVYIVEPTGSFENDPNVTDKKFPGNLTRSYRTESPLKIVGEITDWAKQTPENLREWRERLAKNKGEIIN